MVDAIEKHNMIKQSYFEHVVKRQQDKQIVKVATGNNRLRYLYLLTSKLKSRIDVNDLVNNGTEGFN